MAAASWANYANPDSVWRHLTSQPYVFGIGGACSAATYGAQLCYFLHGKHAPGYLAMSNMIEIAEVNYGEFLRHANLCESLAVDLVEPIDQAALLEVAERWRELATIVRGNALQPANHRKRKSTRRCSE
jgi:hypothetical protein